MNAQIITTPNGERLVVLPEAEFIALRKALEDKADAEAVRAFEQRLAAGEKELIPAEFANRMTGGGNKVRVWREYRGLAARDLAAKASVSGAYLSQIETGAREGSVDVMKRIAAALNVRIDDIV